MSVATTSLTGGMVPAKWRVLNALYFAGQGGINLRTLCKVQDIGHDQLVELDSAGLLVAYLGREPVEIKDLASAPSTVTTTVRVRLASGGRSKVINQAANQVITCLGGRANHVARVRDLKAEAEADDDLLRQMDAAGLIGGGDLGLTPLSALRRLPPEYLIRLTTKGWQYYPRGS